MVSRAPEQSDLEELAATLVDVLGAPACVITVWHTERGQVVTPVGAGLPPDELADLGSHLTTAAPDLLGGLVGARPGVARVGLLPGWLLDLAAAEARQLTPWGLLHVVALPVDGMLADGAGPAPPAGKRDSRSPARPPVVGDGLIAEGPGAWRSPTPLVALVALIHPASRLDLWARRPHLVRLVVRQIELALQVGYLREHLVDEARWLGAVLGQTGEGLVLVDAAGRVAGCNQAAERITGWPAADLYGRSFVDTLDARLMHWNGETAPDADAPEAEDRWAGPLAGAPAAAPLPSTGDSGPARAIQLILTNRDGQQVYTEAGVSQVRGVRGAVLGAVVGLRDVTAQREAEELQATFLSVISHELQTPLSVIRGYAELLADSAETMSPAQLRA
jgi:PAS domain-containing protein